MDSIIFNAIYGLSGQSGFLDFVGTFFARFFVYIIAAVFFSLLLIRREPLMRLRNIFVTGLSLLLSLGIIRSALGYFVSRARPFETLPITPLITASGSSFPSSATILAFTLSTIVAMALSKRWGSWLLALSALVGLSLIYTGVAWPLDVATGAAIGIISPIVIGLILPKKSATVTQTISA